MSNLFEMFSDAMPESMKKQEEELKKKKAKSNASNSSSNNIQRGKPSIPDKDKKQVALPVVVYYAREKLVLEYDPAGIIERNEEELQQDQDALTFDPEEAPIDNLEPNDEDSKDDEKADETLLSTEKEKEGEPVTLVPLGEFMSNINLRITVPPGLVKEGKISKEDARTLLQREYPELSGDRTTMDYDKENAILVPVVNAAVKGR